jgi:hypothetical protein
MPFPDHPVGRLRRWGGGAHRHDRRSGWRGGSLSGNCLLRVAGHEQHSAARCRTGSRVDICNRDQEGQHQLRPHHRCRSLAPPFPLRANPGSCHSPACTRSARDSYSSQEDLAQGYRYRHRHRQRVLKAVRDRAKDLTQVDSQGAMVIDTSNGRARWNRRAPISRAFSNGCLERVKPERDQNPRGGAQTKLVAVYPSNQPQMLRKALIGSVTIAILPCRRSPPSGSVFNSCRRETVGRIQSLSWPSRLSDPFVLGVLSSRVHLNLGACGGWPSGTLEDRSALQQAQANLQSLSVSGADPDEPRNRTASANWPRTWTPTARPARPCTRG